MNKGLKLVAAAWCFIGTAYAQQPNDSLYVAGDNADFTFTESQLDEDNDAPQTVSSISSEQNDAYLSEVGYRFSAMRFRTRAYDNQYNSVYMNGLRLNDSELGRFSYSMIGGMNDATRNKEGVTGFDYNMFGTTGIGGAQNINTRASAFAQGNKIALSGCNRNYVARGMYTYATGLLPSGWAFAGTVGYRWSKEGVIEGTYYNSFSYLLSAEKRWNDHALSLVTFGSPTERAQQGASTEEAYWLANSHYYNPNWGYQGGKKRNARVVHDYEPTAILTWDWKINDDMKLSTSAGFKYSMYSSSALGWNGNAYDPRPDYYKNLPSSTFNVYDTEGQNTPNYLSENPWFLEEYNSLYNYWTSDKANRQINWDRMYLVNQEHAATGGDALYYVERRHNDQMVFAFNTAFNHAVNEHSKYAVGVQLNSTKGMHYKTMDDLLGALRYTDIDKFAARDYGEGSIMAQNDLNNPNRQIGVGDKFGYNYNIYVNQARAWTQYRYNYGGLTFNLGAHIDGTQMEREGLMRNGRAAENSFGKSGKASFLGGGGKFALNYRLGAGNDLFAGMSAESNAPLARNSFVAPRMQNNFVDNLTNEEVFGGELGWKFRFGPVSGIVKGYYTRFNNGVEQTAFYNDAEERFTYLTMTGVDREHYGVEASINWQVTSKLSFNLMGTYGEAKYVNNPLAQLAYEGMDAATIQDLNIWTNPVTGANMPLRVIADGMRVNGTPLTAVSLAANYNTNGWFFELALNYYDRVYVGFSQYNRLSNVLASYTPNGVDVNGNDTYLPTKQELETNGGILFDDKGNYVKAYSPEQEKFDGGFMLDASIGKFIRLKKGKSISINLSLQNITNNRNLRTGGYEQNRGDYYNTGEKRAYVFSKNSKYYYANAINGFLNIGFKF